MPDRQTYPYVDFGVKRLAFFSECQYEDSKALAESWNRSAAELIRQALNDLLERHSAGTTGAQKRPAARWVAQEGLINLAANPVDVTVT